MVEGYSTAPSELTSTKIKIKIQGKCKTGGKGRTHILGDCPARNGELCQQGIPQATGFERPQSLQVNKTSAAKVRKDTNILEFRL